MDQSTADVLRDAAEAIRTIKAMLDGHEQRIQALEHREEERAEHRRLLAE